MAHIYDRDALAYAQRGVIELDFTEENERLADIDRRIEEARRAEHDARLRIDAFNTDRAKAGDHEISRFADALIDGDAATIPVQSNEQAKAEKEALVSARRELAIRIANMESEKREVHQSAKQKVAEALEPLSSIVLEQARKRASDLAASLAELTVIARASGRDMRTVEAAREAVIALRQDYGLLSRERSDIEVPEQIIAALAPLQDAGPALPTSRFEQARTVPI